MAGYPCPDCSTVSATVTAWCDHRWDAHQVDASMPWDTVPREVVTAERARAAYAEQAATTLSLKLGEAEAQLAEARALLRECATWISSAEVQFSGIEDWPIDAPPPEFPQPLLDRIAAALGEAAP